MDALASISDVEELLASGAAMTKDDLMKEHEAHAATLRSRIDMVPSRFSPHLSEMTAEALAAHVLAELLEVLA